MPLHVTITSIKIRIASLLVAMVFFGCTTDNKLAIEPKVIESEFCESCSKVSVRMPHIIDQTKIAETINTAIQEEVISLLQFDEQSEVLDLDTAISSFMGGYEELKKQYEDETTPWEAKINSQITFEDAALVSVSIDAYIFTGGAHGYTTKRFLNFSKKKGNELENWELFEDPLAFQDLAERKFRVKEKIPEDKPINYSGFMFEQDSFYLPENIGFTEKGLQLLYNQYEVSSFADGTIELVLPYQEVQEFLKPKVEY